MTREEAIDIIRKNIPHLGIGAVEMTEALNELVPELRESEDERIRKFLLDYAIEMIAGLESDISHSIYDGIKGRDPDAEAELNQWQKARAYLSSRPKSSDNWKPSDEQMKAFLATHPKIEVPEKYKNPDWLFKKQEQPELDLEIERIVKDEEKFMKFQVRHQLIGYVARHFAKWQYQKDREEFAQIKAKTWCEGFDACKEQMMKDAVEGEIIKDNRGNNVVRAGVFNKDFEYMDKVRIIIVKEDEK